MDPGIKSEIVDVMLYGIHIRHYRVVLNIESGTRRKDLNNYEIFCTIASFLS